MPPKRHPMLIKFVDYVDIMPGAKRIPPNDDERKRLQIMADKLKEFAKAKGIKFVVTKGDGQ